MALIQAQRPGGTGGGGIAISGFQVDTFVQDGPFSAGLELQLTETPVSEDAIIVDQNGQKLRISVDWTYDASNNKIIIQYSDPYADYDNPVVISVQYPYS